MATMLAAAESTGNVNASQLVRDVADRLRYLDPDSAPFTLLLSAIGSNKAEATKIEWAEKGGDFSGAGFAPKWFQINNGAGYTAGDLTFTVDDQAAGSTVGRYVKANDLIKVVRTNEIMLVASTTATTITVATRTSNPYGGTAPAALIDNDDVFVIGSNWAENANVGVPQSFQVQWRFNYEQIFRTPAGASRSQSQVKNYLGDERTRLRREAAVEHKIDIERAFIYGERAIQNPTGNTPSRELGGFFYWATSNITDANGTLSEPEVWAACENVFAHTAGGNSRTMFASAKVCSVVDLLAGSRLMTVPKDETYGISIKQWLTSHGTLNIVKHRLLETGYTGSFPTGLFAGSTNAGYGGMAMIVNIPSLKYRPLQTTVLLPDRQGPGIDGWVDEYLTECSLEFANPLLHGLILDVSG